MAVIEATPPTGHSVYECYVRFWASFYGFHESLLTDPDGLFRGFNLDFWEQSGCSMGEVGAGAHLSQGQAENRIKLGRWSVDRIRFNCPPDSKEGWQLCLAILQGCMNGEVDASKTTPSKRVLGRDVHIMHTALTDSFTTAYANHSLIDIAENARETWNQTRCDRRFRLLLKQSSVP